jgi:DNA transposition AAA+ family ATPase
MNADPRDDANKPTPPTEGRGIEKLGQKGRLEYRMVKDGQDATPDVIAQTIDDLKAWREDNHHDGRPPAWSRIADNIGIPSTTLSEVIAGKYKGNIQPAIVKIDQFLADARARRGRFEFRTTARIGITEAIFGALRTGIRLNTMPVIIGSPGTGKSAHMRAFMTDRPGVIMIRIDEATCHSRGVTKLLCQAIPELRNNTFRTAGKRMDAIKEWLRKHGSTVIIVDEAQKLDRSGL